MRPPWSHAAHIAMHWRPDAIIKTGVIEPMWIRQVSPVDMARKTINPFIDSVRGPGPAVSPSPTPEDIAYAAGKVAEQFAQGKDAILMIGIEQVRVTPSLETDGLVGAIVRAARELAKGNAVAIQAAGRQLVVRPAGALAIPTVTTSSASVTATPVAPSSQGLGMPANAWAAALRPAGPGAMYNYPAIDTSDSPYRATMMNSVQTFGPNVTAEVRAADESVNAQRRAVPAPALASRPALPAPYFHKAETYAQKTQMVRPTPMTAMRRRPRSR